MRYLRMVILVTIFCWLSWADLATAQESSLQPGDRVIVLPMILPVHTQSAADGTIVANLWGGIVSRVVTVETNNVGETWIYLEHNAFGWVPAVVDGEPTLTRYSEDILAEMLAETTQTIETDPDNVDAYLRRGTVYLAQKQYAEAIADYEQAIALQPNEARLNEYAGVAYLDEGNDYAEAEAYFQKAIAGGWQQPGTFNLLGIANEYQYMDSAAADYYRGAIELAPEWGLVYNNLANTYAHAHEYDQAQEYYTQALEHDPYFVSAYINRGLGSETLGDYEAALADFNQAIAIDPFSADAYVRRGDFYAEVYRDYDQSLAEYDQALDLDPENDGAYAARAVTYLFAGKPELAIDNFKQALRLNPHNDHARYNLASTYGMIGYYQDAIAAYTEAIERIGSRYDVSALLYRPQIYIALEDYEKAQADLDLYLIYRSGNTDYFMTVAYLLQGAVALYQGDYQIAAEDYQTAFDLQSEFAAAYYSWGAGYRITRQRETLISELYGKIGADEDNADLYLQLGHVCMEFGRWSEALGAYQQALELQPNPDLQAFVDSFAELIQ